MKNVLILCGLLIFSCTLNAQSSEQEPNNSIPTANFIFKDSIKTGVVQPGTDPSDYFIASLPYDGTLVIYVNATNSGVSNGYLYFYGYDGRMSNGQIVSKYAGNNSNVGPGISISDSIVLNGRAVDSFVFRLDAAGSRFNYSLSYKIRDISVNDVEPNGSFQNALFIQQHQIKLGHISYTSKGIPDSYDYYKTKLEYDGTLKLIINGKNTSGGNGYLYIKAYDGRKGNGSLLAKYISNNSNISSGATIIDTILLYGRAVDSFYLQLESSGSFQYSFKYDIIDSSQNDAEPNNTFASANYIAPEQTLKGHIAYASNGLNDNYDYYKTKIPYDGTLKIMVKGVNKRGGNGYLYMYAYDGRAGNGGILARYISNNSNIGAEVIIYDTIYLYGRAVDSFYMRIESSGAFQYQLKYEMIDSSTVDKEPNGDFAEALNIQENEIKKGHVHYAYNGTYDAYDYYRTLLPNDGTVKLIISGTNNSGNNGYLYLYGYDSRKGNGPFLAKYISNNSNVSSYTTIHDTIYLFGRAKDSFYFRIESSNAWSYTVQYVMEDESPYDTDPNDNFTDADVLNINTETKGHIHYLAAGGYDSYDYYKLILPEDGTVKLRINGKNISGVNGYFYVYAYDNRKGNGPILAKYIQNNSTVGHKATVSDTISLYCQSKDTMYIRLESSGAFQYTFSWDVVSQGINDAETPAGFSTAQPTAIGSNTFGHIGYLKNGGPDASDYYKFQIPIKGSMRIFIEGKNTGGVNGYMYLYGYDKRRGNGTIFARYLKNVSTHPPGVSIRDTIVLNCNLTDTFYLQITSSGCFSYQFNTELIDRQPKANTENERIGNIVGFRPQFTNADNFIWDFGDGKTSTLKYPLKVYPFGYFTARLIVTNSVCNLKDTAEEIIEVKGIEYYTPDSAGSGGDVTMRIFGGGLDTSTKVMLKKGSTEIRPIRKFATKNNTLMNAIFDLHLINETVYDVIIEIPGQSPVTYQNGFRVNKFRYPYTWSEVVAPNRWRTNVDNPFKLIVGNKGNVNASGVLVAFIWPKSVNMKFNTKWFKPPTTGNYSIDAGDTTFNFKYEDIQHFYSDTFNTITSIDTFKGKPYNGYMRLILIPKIAPGSTYEIPLIARSSSVGAQNFITYTFKPNIFGSCPDGSWMDASENLAIEAADGLDRLVSLSPTLEKSPVGWLTKATKGTTKHMANLGQAMGAFYNYATGVTNSIDESLPADYYQNVSAGNAQVTQALIDIGIDKMVDKGADKFMKGQSDNLNNFIAKNPNATQSTIEFAKSNLKDINDIRQAIKDIYKNSKDVKDLNDKLNRLKELLVDCPELQKQIDDLKKNIDKDMTLQDPKETKTNSVTSMDPNAIYGPVGQGLKQYLHNSDRLSFMVSFENMDTALAAAQIITIYDTLDQTAFNLNSFEFTDYTIGNRRFEIPKGRKQFVQEDSLSPLMRVRVNGELNLQKGIITWQFTAIDPATGDIPVFEGFLPPNILKPEGEGSVSYTIQLLPNIADAKIVYNRADIIFDNNASILTNTWENTIDLSTPTSSVTATMLPGKPNILLNFNGNDAGSGIGYYNLYVKMNDEEWLAFGGASTSSLIVEAEYGVKYSFCAIAADQVGNIEDKALSAEATVDLPKSEWLLDALSLRPNPADGVVFVDGLQENASFTIMDISGKILLEGQLQNTNSGIDISGLKTGLYIITISTDSQTVSLKVIKG